MNGGIHGTMDGFKYNHINPHKVYFIMAPYFLAFGKRMMCPIHFYSDSFVGREI